ncbi:MAG: DUF72 domain-containing protein [Thermoproteota archaeon]|nr:DUF72 domain-containing protein [Thermoproteota archaeon]
MNLYVGCSGWSYNGWKGTFYPLILENKKWLPYYSKFFKFVEVDSTFYNIPSKFVVQGWKEKTPDDFKFALKFPKIITHDKKLQDIEIHLYSFFNAIAPLIDKILILLIQLPPYLTEKKGFVAFEKMVKRFDNRYRYALEARESSWFDNKVYDVLKENKISLVWSIRDELKTPLIVTSDQIYIRFIGDRSIGEKDFGKIVKNRDKEMNEIINTLDKIQYGNEEQQTIAIAFNNHFAGFGPQSANTFLKLMDKPVLDWSNEIEQNNSFHATSKYQTSISDYNYFKTRI